MARDRDRYSEDDVETRRPTGGMPVAVIVAGVAIVLVIVAGLAVTALVVFRSAQRAGPDGSDPVTEAKGLADPGPPVVAVPTAGRHVAQLVFAGGEHGATALGELL